MDLEIADAIAILDRTPRVLRALLEDLPQRWTNGNEGPGTWSAFDVVAHLVVGEETSWMPRVRVILGPGPEQRFQPFGRVRSIEQSRGQSLHALLGEFGQLRAANLDALRSLSLTAADLVRTGVHPEFGTVTLGQLLATWAVHDLGHLTQITRVMAKQSDRDVGPWKVYLPVLTR